MKRIVQMTQQEKDVLALELRQERLKSHKRAVALRKQLSELIAELEKEDQRQSDIQESLDNLAEL